MSVKVREKSINYGAQKKKDSGEPQRIPERTPERTRDRIPGSRGAALGGEGPLAGPRRGLVSQTSPPGDGISAVFAQRNTV